MASLPTIRPNADSQDGGWTASGGGDLWAAIDDDPQSPNDADFISSPAAADSGVSVALENMPADLLTLDTLSVTVRYRQQNYVNDPLSMTVLCQTVGGGTTLTGSVTVDSSITESGFTTVTIPFTTLFEFTKSNWDNAEIMFSVNHSASMGTDSGIRVDISAVELNGTYTPSTPVTIDQLAFRWRNDDNDLGEPNAATFMAAENTDVTDILLDTPIRLRLGTVTSDTGAGFDFFAQLEWRLNGGSWNILAAATDDPVILYDSAFYDDADFNFDSYLTLPHSGSFGYGMDTSNPAPQLTVAPANDYEWEFCFEFPSDTASVPAEDGDVFEFRITDGGTPLDTYTETPGLTISVPAGGVELAATLASASGITASLRVEKPLAAGLASTATVTAALRVEKPLAATLASTSGMTAAARVEQRIAATLASVSGLTAALRVEKPLAATLASASSFAADLADIPRHLAATLASSSGFAAALTARKTLAAALGSTGAMTAALHVRKHLAATLGSSSTATASLRAEKPLAAVLASVSGFTAALGSSTISLASTLSSTSTFAAALKTSKPIAATLASTSSLVAALRTGKPLAATLSSTSTLTARLAAIGASLEATLASASTFTAALRTGKPLSAVLASASGMAGNLRSAKPLEAILHSSSTFAASLRARKNLLASFHSQSDFQAQLNQTTPRLLAATFASVGNLYARMTVGTEHIAKVVQSLQMIRTRIGW